MRLLFPTYVLRLPIIIKCNAYIRWGIVIYVFEYLAKIATYYKITSTEIAILHISLFSNLDPKVYEIEYTLN